MTKLSLTAKDEDLLHALRANAREPVASLARKLGLSRTTVQDRLKRLEDHGVISGYTLKLAKDAMPQGFSAWVSVVVEPKKQIDIPKLMARYGEVEALYTVSGKVDFMALVKTRTSEDMDQMIDKIGSLSGVTHVETAVILSTKLDRRQAS